MFDIACPVASSRDRRPRLLLADHRPVASPSAATAAVSVAGVSIEFGLAPSAVLDSTEYDELQTVKDMSLPGGGVDNARSGLGSGRSPCAACSRRCDATRRGGPVRVPRAAPPRARSLDC